MPQISVLDSDLATWRHNRTKLLKYYFVSGISTRDISPQWPERKEGHDADSADMWHKEDGAA